MMTSPRTRIVSSESRQIATLTTTTTTTTNNQQLTTNNQQPTTNNQQPTTNNQQPTTNNQQPTTNNQQPTTNNQQPTTNNQQPTTNNQQPTTNNRDNDKNNKNRIYCGSFTPKEQRGRQRDVQRQQHQSMFQPRSTHVLRTDSPPATSTATLSTIATAATMPDSKNGARHRAANTRAQTSAQDELTVDLFPKQSENMKRPVSGSADT